MNYVVTLEKNYVFFPQKPEFIFDWRKKHTDILNDMGVSQLSGDF